MKLSIQPGGEIRLNGHIHDDLLKYQAPGLKISGASGDYGKLLVHAIPPEPARAYYNIYRIHRNTAFRVSADVPLLIMHIVIQNDKLVQSNGHGKIDLKEGHFNLLYTPGTNYTDYYRKGKDYISLDIFYTLEFLQQWQHQVPSLDLFIEKVLAGEPAMLSEKNCRINIGIMQIVDNIIHYPYKQPTHQLFFDNQCRNLLLYLLSQSSQHEVEEDVRPGEMHGVMNARELITKNFRYHHNIVAIAKETGMNETKLKKGFKDMYGKGMYQYLVDERMLKAKALLTDSVKPVKEIALIVGYKSVSSFIRAFKKKHALSPLALRLNIKRNKSEC